MNRLKRVSGRIIESPKVISAKIKGIDWPHSYTCLTAKDLLGKEAKTVIDIGANKGMFIKAANFVFPNAKIYAFEPQTEFLNIIKNLPNVTAYDFGLWDSEGTDTFYKNKDNDGSSSFLKPTEEYEKYTGKKEVMEEITLKKKRFDELDIEIQRPCFVKIDVEGAEDRVIKGFGEKLHEVDILQIEWFFKKYHENQMKITEVMSILEDYGFIGFIQKEIDYIDGYPHVCDLIFFKEKNKVI
ncbi:FkbM family methyltransferase [Candidatus Pacearchaeota archaeon]|nr:FkbM family methyltransferase [Candidatus Pacearchaeota archaeon]